MESYGDSLTRIGLGFRGTGDISVFVIIIILSLLAAVGIFLGIRNLLQGYRAIRSIKPGEEERPAEGFLKGRENLNAAQIKAVYDLISDFKRKEILAEAIPVSVLEHFAEYFYRNIGRLNISRGIAKLFTPSLFPLTVNMPVEIELVHLNKLFIFKKNVIERTDRKITVHKIDNLAELTGESRQIMVSYISNKFYIQGQSKILNPDERGMLALSYPQKLVISKERRFARVPILKEVDAFLKLAQHPEAEKIKTKIRDISMEGLRVESGTILKRNAIYLLDFEDRHFETPYRFDNFECTVTKSMISEGNVFEYGLAFVYVNLTNRARLANYVNEWVDPFKMGPGTGPAA